MANHVVLLQKWGVGGLLLFVAHIVNIKVPSRQAFGIFEHLKH
jgi:hypothetical protein